MGVRGPIGDIQPFVELAQRPDTFVYKAYQRSLERFVLLKVMRPDEHVSAERAQRFRQEARLVARIQHPNVVSVYDYGESDGETYIISEFVEGCDLATLLEGGRLPVDVALYVLRMIARGLVAAHEHGVLHRDVKPANILVSGEGDVKIADFGMASLQSDAGDVRGTLAYLSPEQIRGSAADERSDLFSLGATLFEMLAGRQAFQASGRSATIDAILHFDPLPLIDADRRIPTGLRDLCAALLDKEPERRPSTSAAVLAQLSKIERATPAASREQVVLFLQDPTAYAPSPRMAGAPVSDAISNGTRRWRSTAFFAIMAGLTVSAVAAMITWIITATPAPESLPVAGGAGNTEQLATASTAEDVLNPADTQPGGTDSDGPLPTAGREPADEVRPPASELDETILPLPSWESMVDSPAPAAADLHVTSDPWVAVFVNGDSVGTTPMETLSLAPGRHDVVLRNPYFPAIERSIYLEPGAVDTLSVSLWATVAQVSVHAKPWAVVYLNGEDAGTVPLRNRPFYLVPGRHVLRFENSVLGVVREVTLTVRAGEARTIEIDLLTGSQ